MSTVEYPAPAVIFGTGSLEPSIAEETVYSAILAGYRHIDNAVAYGNEVQVGAGIRRAIADGLARREEILVTSKASNDRRDYDSVRTECESSLRAMGLEYFDLYLIHWPVPRHMEDCYVELNRETWQAMLDLRKRGLVRAIGVCNFLKRHIESMVAGGEYPCVNQIEIHPKFQENEVVEYCHSLGMQVQAWGALGNGALIRDEALTAIAERYGVSTAQLCLKWCLQRGVTPIAQARDPVHMRANLDLAGFEISEADMQLIARMNTSNGHRDMYSYIRQRDN